MNKQKVLMIVRTSGLEYDDRVRKEAISLKALGYDVFILANYISNSANKGITEYGIPYEVVRLRSRAWFRSARFLLIKMLEFWIISTWKIVKGNYTIVWAHEEYTVLSLLIKLPKIRYVFDQHELPEFLVGSKFRKKLYDRIERLADSIIVANHERLEYMKSIGLIKHPQKYFVLKNYPDHVFSKLKMDKISHSLESWLKGSEYVLMQGGGHESRYPIEVITAIKKYGKHKIVLVGPVDQKVKAQIEEQYKSVVYFTGYINQLALTQYIDHARYSIILYNDHNPNEMLCEPNRLYQAICRGVPVIVGMNPPMKNLVEQYGIGQVLSDDGKDSNGIFDAILKMELNISKYRENVSMMRDTFIWESQEAIITKILPTK